MDLEVFMGMNSDAGELFEWIGDHTKCTHEENEAKLMKMPGVGKIYEAVTCKTICNPSRSGLRP